MGRSFNSLKTLSGIETDNSWRGECAYGGFNSLKTLSGIETSKTRETAKGNAGFNSLKTLSGIETLKISEGRLDEEASTHSKPFQGLKQ